MTSIDKTYYKVGLTGNHYVYGFDENCVKDIAILIGEKEDIVYFNEKYHVFTIRIKDKTLKEKLRNIYNFS